MAVFQTAGEPPNSGSTIFVNIGCSQNSRRALRHNVPANIGSMTVSGRGLA